MSGSSSSPSFSIDDPLSRLTQQVFSEPFEFASNIRAYWSIAMRKEQNFVLLNDGVTRSDYESMVRLVNQVRPENRNAAHAILFNLVQANAPELLKRGREGQLCTIRTCIKNRWKTLTTCEDHTCAGCEKASANNDEPCDACRCSILGCYHMRATNSKWCVNHLCRHCGVEPCKQAQSRPFRSGFMYAPKTISPFCATCACPGSEGCEQLAATCTDHRCEWCARPKTGKCPACTCNAVGCHDKRIECGIACEKHTCSVCFTLEHTHRDDLVIVATFDKFHVLPKDLCMRLDPLLQVIGKSLYETCPRLLPLCAFEFNKTLGFKKSSQCMTYRGEHDEAGLFHLCPACYKDNLCSVCHREPIAFGYEPRAKARVCMRSECAAVNQCHGCKMSFVCKGKALVMVQKEILLCGTCSNTLNACVTCERTGVKKKSIYFSKYVPPPKLLKVKKKGNPKPGLRCIGCLGSNSSAQEPSFYVANLLRWWLMWPAAHAYVERKTMALCRARIANSRGKFHALPFAVQAKQRERMLLCARFIVLHGDQLSPALLDYLIKEHPGGIPHFASLSARELNAGRAGARGCLGLMYRVAGLPSDLFRVILGRVAQ
jgi:hypothetical protein